MNKNLLEEYIKRGFSIIPIGNDKKPLITWKEYQHRQPSPQEVLDWIFAFEEFNTGIITGFNGFYSLDIDKKEYFKYLPQEITKTMLTETQRGFHLNFTYDKELKGGLINLGGFKVEFKGLGQYVIEPFAVINGFEYKPINSIESIKPLPSYLLDLLLKEEEKAIKEIKKAQEIKEQFKYFGSADCIRQILERELEEGEREKSLFILFNLLLRDRNSIDYAKSLVLKKNKSLLKPLNESEITRSIFQNQIYNKMGCRYVRENLQFVRCENCKFYKEVVRMNFREVLFDKNLNDKDKQIAYFIMIEEKNKVIDIQKELQGISRKQIYNSLNKLKKLGYLNGV
ncbi:MAG: bifunctional DNA primase/polymerase [Candidatus Micrarchaeaceae archaeon]